MPSVREYAILYVGRRVRQGGGIVVGGGNAVLETTPHALDGPEHTEATLLDRLLATEEHSGLLLPLSGDSADGLHGDGTWAPFAGSGSTLPWFNVMDYGATADGVTDDTTAIQDTIDACPAEGVVFIPAGRYSISTIAIDKSITVMGDGTGQTMLIPSSDVDVVTLNVGGGASVNGGTIRDIGIFPTTNRSAGAALRLGYIATWRFENIRIGSGLGGQPFVGVRVDRANNCLFTGLIVEGCASHGVLLEPGSSSSIILDITFEGKSQILANDGDGFFLQTDFDVSGGATVEGIEIRDTTIYANGDNGIRLFTNHASGRIRNIYVQNVVIDGNTLSGVRVDASSLNLMRRVMIDNSWIASNGESGVNLLAAVSDWRVTGCEILNNQHRGIYVDMDSTVRDGLISNNTIYFNSQATDATYYGIHLADVDGVTVIGNRLFNTAELSNKQNGLSIDATSSKIDVIGNYLATGAGTTPYTNAGSVVRLAFNVTSDTAWDDPPFSTSETDTSLRLAPDGAGGVAWATGSAAAALDDLTDVTAPSPIQGDELRWNGSAWVNSTGFVVIQAPTPTVAAGPPFSVTITSVWGIDGSGDPYYDGANVTSGEEAALCWDPLLEEYALVSCVPA